MCYWSLAFVIGSAIPQVQNISGLIAAICIMQFTYTFPPVFRLAYDMITDAMLADGEYEPGSMSTAHRIDTWKDWSRWKRVSSSQFSCLPLTLMDSIARALHYCNHTTWMQAMVSGRWYYKLFNFIIFLACLSMACLGTCNTLRSSSALFYRTDGCVPCCNPQYCSVHLLYLGMYGSGKSIEETFKLAGAPTSFSCNSPVA